MTGGAAGGALYPRCWLRRSRGGTWAPARGGAARGSGKEWLRDAWGQPFRLVRRDHKVDHQTRWRQFDYHELVSAGPDEEFDTEDDLRQLKPDEWPLAQGWWLGGPGGLAR